MRIYTIHRRGGGAEMDLRPIKEGFCWPAALFTLFWALWHGLWVSALVLLAAQVLAVLAAALLGMDEVARWLLGLAVAAVFGVLANDLRRRRLERRGFAFDDVVVADGPEDAAWRFLAKRTAPRATAGFAP